MGVHAYEVHAHGVHAYEVYAHKVHANEVQHLRISLKPWRAQTRLSRDSAFNSLFSTHQPWPHVLFLVQLMVIEGSEMS
jgi:hypothetical protein